MPWVRYDDQFPHHSKVAEVKLHDRTALALHLLCGTWSAGTSTPGRVSEAATVEQAGGKARAKKWAAVLVNAGLWHAPGHGCDRCPAVTSGFVIHDWAVYNPFEELSKKRSEAGKKGAAARWGKPSESPGKSMANAIAEPSQTHTGANGNPVAENAPSPSPSPVPTSGSYSEGDLGRHPADRYAGAPKTDDDQSLDKINDRIEGRIIEVLMETTGRTVDRAHASTVRRQLLDARPVRDPLAYVAAAIRGEPQRYLPTSGAPWEAPPPRLGPKDPDHAYDQRAAEARRLLAEKRQKGTT